MPRTSQPDSTPRGLGGGHTNAEPPRVDYGRRTIFALTDAMKRARGLQELLVATGQLGAAAAARNLADDLAFNVRESLARYPWLVSVVNETRDLAEDARRRAALEDGFIHVGRLP